MVTTVLLNLLLMKPIQNWRIYMREIKIKYSLQKFKFRPYIKVIFITCIQEIPKHLYRGKLIVSDFIEYIEQE